MDPFVSNPSLFSAIFKKISPDTIRIEKRWVRDKGIQKVLKARIRLPLPCLANAYCNSENGVQAADLSL